MHGCAVGLVAQVGRHTGRPMLKPWTISTSCPDLYRRVLQLKCRGGPGHRPHAPCTGLNAKLSENYTDEFASMVHDSLDRMHLRLRPPGPSAVVQQTMPGLIEPSENLFADITDVEVSQLAALVAAGLEDPTLPATPTHRVKAVRPPLWNALVTKSLHPKDPLFHSEAAKDAVDAELAALRAVGTWDESGVMEFKKAVAQYPESHYARLFSIVGIKNHELAEDLWKWKGRIVFGGDQVKTASGDWAVFQDVGSTPSTMEAARALIGVSALSSDLELLQSDCLRAYTQAELTGPPTFVRLPRRWWPKEWIGVYDDPVVPLR